MSRPGVFLDRDGTVIADPGYLGRPEDVRLLEGAAPAIARLNRADLPVILITNQSGIGRGYYTEKDFEAAEAELERRLAIDGAHLDGVYFCPHDPTVHHCACRKPGLELFRRAIEAHDLDPAASWFVGDRMRDVAPAAELGGRGVLVAAEDGTYDPDAPDGVARAESLSGAVDLILEGPAARPLGVVVLVSGSGSNLQALIDRFAGSDAVEIAGVLADRPDIRALERAARAGISTRVLRTQEAEAAWLAGALREFDADLVVLAGYLRLVPAAVVREWSGRMLNIHPALLPAFGGPGMYGRYVHEAVLEAGVSESGATVHLVDEAYDRGPIVAQRRVPVLPGDDAGRLAARVLEAEHVLLPDVVAAIADGSLRLEDFGTTHTTYTGD